VKNLWHAVREGEILAFDRSALAMPGSWQYRAEDRMLLFRQLFDPQSSTYTYLLGDARGGDAVLIDPVFEQVRRDAALIGELGLRLVATLETHIHADHVTGAWLLRRALGSQIMLAAASGAEGADRYLVQDDVVAFGTRLLLVRATPGHTNSCVTYVLDDHSMAFTGDCLLIRGSGRTDFQQGDPAAMYRSVHDRIFSLPDDCLLYPAHDYRGLTVTSVAEERRFNPRLGGEIAVGDFTGYMKNMRLAHPKLIDVAVPANLRCGRPENETGLAHTRLGPRYTTALPDYGRSTHTGSKSTRKMCRSSMCASPTSSPARSVISPVRSSFRSANWPGAPGN
jgi:glyoxylase-like metal-dependent hydrolase (beta-lactamase superfamily II)